MEKVVILGNGFDLDLGLRTTYSDFINSQIFKDEVEKGNSLALAIKLEKTIHKWIDLESFFKKYVLRYSDVVSYEEIYGEFTKVRDLLTQYINGIEIEYDKIAIESIASKFIASISENGDYDIYSFNYTDFSKICDVTNHHIGENKCHYIHGLAKRNNIILGTEDDKNIGNNFSFIFKYFDHNYNSNNINKVLEGANSIIFFGHSLGETDYHYFSNFFNVQSNRSLYKESKEITIFTYDKGSEREILNQLRNMGGDNSVGLLRDMNRFQIFCTSLDEDRDKITQFLENLGERGSKKLIKKAGENLRSLY